MIEESVEAMLNHHQARVLGCLMEKQMTTPDYYPLTLKALTAACNQKSSRVPVMDLTASEVGGVVNDLRTEGLITARMDGRVDRFEHHLSRKLKLSCKQRAVLCVLMLRSALTLNEIRISTGRMVTFESSDELQALLDQLMDADNPLLLRISRTAGQREDRYGHVLCGKAVSEIAAGGSHMDAEQLADSDQLTHANQCIDSNQPTHAERISRLEKELTDLKQQVQLLVQQTKLAKD